MVFPRESVEQRVCAWLGEVDMRVRVASGISKDLFNIAALQARLGEAKVDLAAPYGDLAGVRHYYQAYTQSIAKDLN